MQPWYARKAEEKSGSICRAAIRRQLGWCLRCTCTRHSISLPCWSCRCCCGGTTTGKAERTLVDLRVPTCPPSSVCCIQLGFARTRWEGQLDQSSHALWSSQALCTTTLAAQLCHSMHWLPLPHPSASTHPQRFSACERAVLTTTATDLHPQVCRTQAKPQALL